MDRGVARPAEQLIRRLVPEGRQSGRIREPDQPLGIDDPDRLGDRLQHRGEEVLSLDLPATEISEGNRHGARASLTSRKPRVKLPDALVAALFRGTRGDRNARPRRARSKA